MHGYKETINLNCEMYEHWVIDLGPKVNVSLFQSINLLYVGQGRKGSFFGRGRGMKKNSYMYMYMYIYCLMSLEQRIAVGQSDDCQALRRLVIFSNFKLIFYKLLIAFVTYNYFIYYYMFCSHNLCIHVQSLEYAMCIAK